MQSSKLQTCLHVLKVLEKKPQSTFDDLLQDTKLERNQLEYSLDLLAENLLVREQTNLNNKIVYSATERGSRVLSFFSINGIFSVSQ